MREGKAVLKESTFCARRPIALSKHHPISEKGKAWPAGVHLKIGVPVPHIATMAVICTTDHRPRLHALNWPSEPVHLRPDPGFPNAPYTYARQRTTPRGAMNLFSCWIAGF